MGKKIYTGAYLLTNPDHKSQFGLVDGESSIDDDKINIRISLGKQLIDKMTIENKEVTINLSLEECNRLSEVLKTVENSIKLLVTLSKRGKLKDEAYLD
jgi:hypothetical protein